MILDDLSFIFGLKVVKIFAYTRDIWKVLSMVFYLSNRNTNPVMFGIILKSYLFSMFWHKFHEDIIMQTRKNTIVNTCTVGILEKKENISGKYNIFAF